MFGRAVHVVVNDEAAARAALPAIPRDARHRLRTRHHRPSVARRRVRLARAPRGRRGGGMIRALQPAAPARHGAQRSHPAAARSAQPRHGVSRAGGDDRRLRLHHQLRRAATSASPCSTRITRRRAVPWSRRSRRRAGSTSPHRLTRPEQIDPLLNRGAVRMALVIPPDFEQNLLALRPAPGAGHRRRRRRQHRLHRHELLRGHRHRVLVACRTRHHGPHACRSACRVASGTTRRSRAPT